MDGAASIPAEVWDIVLSYACPVDHTAPGFHPLDSESRLLNSNIGAALNERLIAVSLSDRDFPPLALMLPPGQVATRQTEASLYSQKRTVIALCDAPPEMLETVTQVEGGFLSREGKATAGGGGGESHGLKTGVAPIVSQLLERLSNLTVIEGPFLRSCTCLKVVDLRHMTQLKEIGSDFLSFSSVEEVYLPSSLECVGHRFLYESKVQSLDLSMTRLTTVGSEFLAHTPLFSITFPSTLKTAGGTFLGCQDSYRWKHKGKALSRLDLSHTSLEFIGDGFLVESSFEEVLLPSTLTRLGDWCLKGIEGKCGPLYECSQVGGEGLPVERQD